MVKSKKIIIATHYLMYGSAHALRDYLISEKVKHLLFVGLPFHTQRKKIVEYYEHGVWINTSTTNRVQKNEIINYLLDLIELTILVLKRKERYDLFIGVNNLNCLAGILLKKLGIVNKVIYYSIDFVPIRFPNRILNWLYHNIEIFAVNNSDEVWNVSPRIAEGREEYLGLKNSPKQIVVPIGVWEKDTHFIKLEQKNLHKIVFIGHILEKQGVQLVIKALQQIVQNISDIEFTIIGDGEYLSTLKKLVKDAKLTRNVHFKGQISDKQRINTILKNSALAVATYKPEKLRLHNFTYYADPTKIKDYLSMSLPVILTNVPYNAYYLEKKKCAIVVEYNANKIASSIINLISDVNKLNTFRQNSYKLSRSFNWNIIFGKLDI